MLLTSKLVQLKSKFKQGFTLIELLIVIAIIGILAALILTNLSGARQRARDARRKVDLDSIAKAVRLYYNDNQSFPSQGANNTIGACSPAPCQWGSAFTSSDGKGTLYMNFLPTDPSSIAGGTIAYKYYSTGDSFAVVASLENASDPSIATSQSACTGFFTPAANDYIVCMK
jgi:general secretion pathway protein G